MLTCKIYGNINHTKRVLEKVQKMSFLKKLDEYGKFGVEVLSAATPKDTGVTAQSWTYKITSSGRQTTIEWVNTNTVNGVNIAIILQYGHGTKNGAYVTGVDYINPAMRKVFEKIKREIQNEVR